MSDPSSDRIQKVAFIASLVFGAYLYGYATRGFGWFPNNVLDTGWDQLQSVKQAVSGDDHPATFARVYDREGTRVYEGSASLRRGLTLVPSIWKDFDWQPGLKLVDGDGRVVHQWRVDPAELFPDVFDGPLMGLTRFSEPKNSYLFPNGDVALVIDQVGTVRLDACGQIVWRVKGHHHHSLTRAEDGTLWVSGRKTPPRQPDPLTGQDSVRHDLLVHISEEGETLREVDVFDILRENTDLARRHFRFQPQDTHLNDVEPLPPSMAQEYPLFEAGDLLVSLRHLNVIFVADPVTLQVKWWVGKPFIRQHDPDFVGDGWIGVFDNNNDGTDRGSRFGGSRILAFEPHTDSVAVWLDSSTAGHLYTSARGNWQALDDGRFVMTESNAGRVLEVGPDGQVLWEWVQQSYGDERVPGISRAERYDLSAEQIAGWPCSPEGESVKEGGSE